MTSNKRSKRKVPTSTNKKAAQHPKRKNTKRTQNTDKRAQQKVSNKDKLVQEENPRHRVSSNIVRNYFWREIHQASIERRQVYVDRLANVQPREMSLDWAIQEVRQVRSDLLAITDLHKNLPSKLPDLLVRAKVIAVSIPGLPPSPEIIATAQNYILLRRKLLAWCDESLKRCSRFAQTSDTQGGQLLKYSQPDVTAQDQTEWQSIQEIGQQVKKLAPTDRSILLLGETGTGKEFYAREIHKASDRKSERYEVINCATLPKERIDSELFGYVKGAFTGATGDYPGKIRQAEGGTVFLDEIGDLPRDCWGNLLRFLQDSEVHPLKGNTVSVNVRILAATNKPNLVPEEARHRFDYTLHLPPLRARRHDIPALAGDFFESSKACANKRSSMRFSQRERNKLGQDTYDWPGNIRQLEKAIQRAVDLHGSGRSLTAQKVLDAAKLIPSLP